MPIATCYTHQIVISHKKWDNLVSKWATHIGIQATDISLTVISNTIQSGEIYHLKVHLFLPSLWPEKSVQRIQGSFIALAEEILGISSKDIFLITQIISSGHVLDRGNTANW